MSESEASPEAPRSHTLTHSHNQIKSNSIYILAAAIGIIFSSVPMLLAGGQGKGTPNDTRVDGALCSLLI